MTRVCRACDGPVCVDCGGCIREGECSCVEDLVQERSASLKQLLAEYYQVIAQGKQWGQEPDRGIETWEKHLASLQERARTLLPELCCDVPTRAER